MNSLESFKSEAEEILEKDPKVKEFLLVQLMAALRTARSFSNDAYPPLTELEKYLSEKY